MIFARRPKIRIWIKEKEGREVTLTAGPACQGHLPHSRGDSRRRFPSDSEVSGPNHGHHFDPQTRATRLIPFSPRRNHQKWLAVDHGGSALCRNPQAGRAWPRVSYGTSGLRRSFLGKRLGLKRRGTRWPRETPSSTETRRRCASCLTTVSAVERPPSGANAHLGT